MKTPHFIIMLFAIISVSCNAWMEADREISVYPPIEDFPWESWDQLEGVLYVWSSETEIHSKQLGNEENLNMTVPRCQTVIILAYPIYSTGIGLYPASTNISPEARNDQKNFCLFEPAPLDQTIIRAVANGCPLQVINYTKWKAYYLEKKPYNTWKLQSPLLEEALTAGRANSHSLKFQESVTVKLTGLPTGLFIPENPFLSCWYVETDGTAELDLYPGFHRFLIAGTSDLLLVTVSEQGESDWFLEEYPNIEPQTEDLY